MTLNKHPKLKETFLSCAGCSGQCPHLAVPCCVMCAAPKCVWSLWLSPCRAAAKYRVVLDRLQCFPEVMSGVGMEVISG